jgi:acyl-CoA reductase-like NAD-dependent aldehyde dehydrogenase
MPPAAFQVLHGAGDVGATLAEDPRIKVVCFTGGPSAGRSIARAAAQHLTVLQLELGGNNPVLVLDDADPEATAASLARGMTLLNGQWREGPRKVLVHRAVAADFLDALTAHLGEVRIGHSLDESTMLGPLAHSGHRDLLTARLEALRTNGAQLITPVAAPDGGGSYLGPTLAVGADPGLATEELFGPAVSVHLVDDNDDAVRHANAHASGLAATVYGDTDRAMTVAARVMCGEVRVNGIHLDDLGAGSAQSFWGGSGLGGHGPAEPMRVFRGYRVIGVDGDDLMI